MAKKTSKKFDKKQLIKWVDERVESKGDEDSFSLFEYHDGGDRNAYASVWRGNEEDIIFTEGEIDIHFDSNESLSFESGKVDVIMDMMRNLEKVVEVFGGKITWGSDKKEKNK